MMIGCVAPVARTVLTSDCIPTACQPCGSRQPSRQQDHVTSCGSLNRSKITDLSFTNVDATDDQNAGAWSASGIGSRVPVAEAEPGATNWRSRITPNPAAWRVCT